MFAAGAAYIGLLDDLARRYSFSCLVAVWSVVAEACLGLLIIAYYVVTQVLIVAPLLAIVLSLIRLVVSHYGNAGGDAANAEKLKASLRIFYSLFWRRMLSSTCGSGLSILGQIVRQL